MNRRSSRMRAWSRATCSRTNPCLLIILSSFTQHPPGVNARPPPPPARTAPPRMPASRRRSGASRRAPRPSSRPRRRAACGHRARGGVATRPPSHGTWSVRIRRKPRGHLGCGCDTEAQPRGPAAHVPFEIGLDTSAKLGGPFGLDLANPPKERAGVVRRAAVEHAANAVGPAHPIPPSPQPATDFGTCAGSTPGAEIVGAPALVGEWASTAFRSCPPWAMAMPANGGPRPASAGEPAYGRSMRPVCSAARMSTTAAALARANPPMTRSGCLPGTGTPRMEVPTGLPSTWSPGPSSPSRGRPSRPSCTRPRSSCRGPPG